ncbi:hypothetical protein Ppa06_21890 [Planomonospora parontospora subsp. parontospora]|uniref:DUF262 domain-containing protein n=2 Tax=Planomonospora parontospora TaxID=58119 RepID=A0AA37F4K1_9ACTN|nr:DUF262 domain-containing protein [Planomonospora parontospora]GGK65687.1 hypothetical protein GCM10010126_26300 [Planomonospora parontospora]GII08391.1 hypothetical protein Ppa06_21890 [Planomonospora parontospora subsp. parontospora]
MKANETTLRRLIQGEQQLLVPLYQRTYTWEREQLMQLWADVLTQVDVLAEGRRDAPSHFLGSVVLAPGPDLAPNRSQWIVVDGQQRLTTLMLALCAVRDHLVAEDPGAVERINELHLTNRFQHGEMRYRLLPTQRDRAAFKACVDGTPEGRADSLIGNAYQFFATMLRKFDDPADPHDIDRVETVLLDRLNLVQILVEKDDNAFRIFESINNTGMRLSQVDLIRNYVFMCLPTLGQHVYDTYWEPIQKLLDPKAMDQLMYLVLVLRHGEEAQYNAVYRGHQRLLTAMAHDEARVEAYVRELARRARHLKRILSPDEDTPVGRRLSFLGEWQAATTYPLVMKLLEFIEDGHVTEDETAEALLYVESFLVRRLIAGVTTGNLNRIFQRIAVQLSPDEPSVPQAVRTALSPARLYWPSDEQLREEIRNRAFYWQGRTAQQKLVLRRLEEALGSKERVDLSDKKITIEHVLPQTPTAEWLNEISLNGEDPDLLHRQLVHTLGNLTLSGYNSELGNVSFARKRDQLKQSGLVMNQEIAAAERWGKAEILVRADRLTDRALSIWPGPEETNRGSAASRDWTLLHNALAALPPATWTSYSELAELIGSHAVPVGVHLAGNPVPNAHRVLTKSGQVSEGFRWQDSEDERDVHDVLRGEGIRLDEAGRAAPDQWVSARELAELLSLPGAADLAESELTGEPEPDAESVGEREQRFLRQLNEQSGPQAAGAVQRVLDHWRVRGGEVQYGTAAGASCAPVIRVGGRAIAVIRFYAKTIEVPFGTLKKRPPFDDQVLREELRQRLNDAPGVDIPVSKLELYPSIKTTQLVNTEVFDVVVAVLDWFAAQMVVVR